MYVTEHVFLPYSYELYDAIKSSNSLFTNSVPQAQDYAVCLLTACYFQQRPVCMNWTLHRHSIESIGVVAEGVAVLGSALKKIPRWLQRPPDRLRFQIVVSLRLMCW